MREEEIMVGDWIQTNYTNHTKFKVVGFDTSCGEVQSKSWIYYLDNCEPIPLTKEILEKNGFTDCESDFEMGVYHYYIGEKNFIADSSLHIGTENHTCYWLNYKKTFAIYDIRYVHELQHAFRICKIEKEIEL